MARTRTAVGLKVRVRGQAVNRPADQWAVITGIARDSGELHLRMLGDDNPTVVKARDLTGVELCEGLDVLFQNPGLNLVSWASRRRPPSAYGTARKRRPART